MSSPLGPPASSRGGGATPGARISAPGARRSALGAQQLLAGPHLHREQSKQLARAAAAVLAPAAAAHRACLLGAWGVATSRRQAGAQRTARSVQRTRSSRPPAATHSWQVPTRAVRRAALSARPVAPPRRPRQIYHPTARVDPRRRAARPAEASSARGRRKSAAAASLQLCSWLAARGAPPRHRITSQHSTSRRTGPPSQINSAISPPHPLTHGKGRRGAARRRVPAGRPARRRWLVGGRSRVARLLARRSPGRCDTRRPLRRQASL